MATIQELEAKATEVMDVLNTIDLKLDEVKAYIQTLQGAATSEQLDVILGMLNSAKDKASSVLAETDALDDATPPAPVEG